MFSDDSLPPCRKETVSESSWRWKFADRSPKHSRRHRKLLIADSRCLRRQALPRRFGSSRSGKRLAQISSNRLREQVNKPGSLSPRWMLPNGTPRWRSCLMESASALISRMVLAPLLRSSASRMNSSKSNSGGGALPLGVGLGVGVGSSGLLATTGRGGRPGGTAPPAWVATSAGREAGREQAPRRQGPTGYAQLPMAARSLMPLARGH